MMKDVFLTLRSIFYSGTSIGNDIRIEIEAIGQPFEENYEINRDSKRKLEEPIGKFTVDQGSFSIPITVRIIERDIAHNDVGVIEEKIKVNLNEYEIQKKTIRVEVKEMGWLLRKQQAVFDVGFDIQVMDVMQYIKETDDGFVKVIMDGYNKEQSLPSFLRIRFDKHKAGRDYFTVMEGWRQGETESVKLDDDGKSFLVP